MTAFIIRPFGIKDGVDFDKVDKELISPALERLNLTGRTTLEIIHAGNIRTDMFQLLLTADVVVADISIHNANVFYELGIRHALRDKWTVLIRADLKNVPFDLLTDRYLEYDASNPGAALEQLVEALAQTRRNQKPDSPVFNLLPGLQPLDQASFVVVPQDFSEEVQRAAKMGEKGDLRFLASELNGFRWRREGLRAIGEAQFHMGDKDGALESWEAVRRELPYDLLANLRLGTLYQKLGDLVRSDQALERVIAQKDVKDSDRAEAHALIGSNEKTRWIEEWKGVPPEDRAAEALRSPYLFRSFSEYKKGFEADPGHYYSGLNALALATIVTELAAALPAVWQKTFPDKPDAASKLREYRNMRAQLGGAVEFALEACRQRLERAGREDKWLSISIADHAFLCGKRNAEDLYRKAISTIGPFAKETASRQFQLFTALGILPRSTDAVARVFAVHAPIPAAAQPPKVILFTGHRIDDRGRATPRFPAGQEAVARDAIRRAVERELPREGRTAVAIAGGASGGDILFLEVCAELGIERQMYLIIPRGEYMNASVEPSGSGWKRRFESQRTTAARCREYQQSKELPAWLQERKDYSVWQRSNLWCLYNALALGGAQTTLIALWDRRAGDGPGGTQDMVERAKDHGARTIILDTNELFGLRTTAV